MAVKLRLKRFGRRHLAVYRLGAMESRSPRQGTVLEDLGTYEPGHKDPLGQVRFNKERIEHWLKMGATPSETVGALLKKHGIGRGKA